MNKEWIKYLIPFIILLISILGCTQKKNSIGYPGDGPQPKEIIISDTIFFGNFYSFEDSCRNFNYNSKLLLGKYRNTQVFTLLKFTTFPDTVFEFLSDITLTLYKRSELNFSDPEIKIGKITEYWNSNETTWFAATDTTDWINEGNFWEEITDIDFAIEADSINIRIPENIITGWIEEDSLNYGLVIFSEEDSSFVELYSSNESDAEKSGPVLSFYRETEEDTTTVFFDECDFDTFIYSSDQDFNTFDQLLISNIQPVKMFMEFDISDSVFFNADSSEIENANDYKWMTINKAELILQVEENETYLSDPEISIRPYLVLNENPSIPFAYETDYEYIAASTVDTLSNNEYKIDITDFVQEITSGQKDNFGILLKSTNENKDFSHLRFADKNNIDEAKRPKVKIIYTPPYLDD